jgi:hypothetical protein
MKSWEVMSLTVDDAPISVYRVEDDDVALAAQKWVQEHFIFEDVINDEEEIGLLLTNVDNPEVQLTFRVKVRVSLEIKETHSRQTNEQTSPQAKIPSLPNRSGKRKK